MFLILIEYFCFSSIVQLRGETEFTSKETETVQYYPTGEKKAQGEKKGDKLVGRWMVWWKNGNVCRIVNYDDEGKYHGEQLFYAPDGKLDKKIYYIHGEKVSEEEFRKYEAHKKIK